MANSEGGKSRKRNFTTLLVGIKREGEKKSPACCLQRGGGRKRTWPKVAFFGSSFFCELAVGGGFGRVEKCGSLSFCLF